MWFFAHFHCKILLKDYHFCQVSIDTGYVRVYENCQIVQKLHLLVCGNVQLLFFIFPEIWFVKLNIFLKIKNNGNGLKIGDMIRNCVNFNHFFLKKVIILNSCPKKTKQKQKNPKSAWDSGMCLPWKILHWLFVSKFFPTSYRCIETPKKIWAKNLM